MNFSERQREGKTDQADPLKSVPVKRKRGIQIFIKAWGIRKKTEHIDPFKRRKRVGFGL